MFRKGFIMVLETTNYYWKSFEEMSSRLDFVYYHPSFDFIKEFRNLEKTFKVGSIISEPEYGNSLSGRDEGKIGFLNGQHITENGDLIFPEKPLFVNELLTDDDLLMIDDILISRSGTVGKAVVITEEYEGFAFGSFCIRFKVNDKKKTLPEFVAKFINSGLGMLQVQLLKTGAIQSNINSDQIKDIVLPEITGERQAQILHEISFLENESKIFKNKAIRLQNASVNYFTQKLNIPFPEEPNYFFKTGSEKQTLTFDVFPDEIEDRINYLFFHPKYKLLEKLITDYKTVTLESICTREVTPGVQPEFIENGEKTVLKTVDLKNRYIDYENALKVSDKFYTANTFAEVKKGDIIIAATGYVSMGKIDVYDSNEPSLISGELLAFTVNKDYDPYFISYFLRSHLGQIQIEKFWTGSSGQIHLYAKDVKKFILPSYETIPKKQQIEIAFEIRKMIEEAIKLEEIGIQKQFDARKLFEELVLKEIE